jgi:hypothetical protein
MKSFKFIFILFLLFFGLLSPNYSQTNKVIQISGRVMDVKRSCTATKIRIFNSNRKQIGTENSDNDGVFQLNLQYNKEYYILFNCENYRKQFKLVYISTVGLENISKKTFDLPTIIGINDIAG